MYLFTLVGGLLLLSNSCKKDDPPSNIVTDIDGNAYHTVTIGTQVWMVENLKVTHYRNCDPIFNITDSAQWSNLTTGAYCGYENKPSNSKTYGNLYNWYAVNDSRNIAPAGWHVPTDTEWKILTTFLGGESVAGKKLKETDTIHWLSFFESSATNETGFIPIRNIFKSNTLLSSINHF